ncbi:MAG: TonB family protein [Burkholderiales bacterium]|nr:TonB family protein [Burkholderiales bacterium]
MKCLSFSTLQWALGASIAVHAALLAVRFVDPQTFNRVFQETPLEVILVNARTNERPTKAQAIAQASIVGGGDAPGGRATSPLPPAPLSQSGDANEAQAQARLQTLTEQQNLLLAEVRSRLAAMPAPDPNRPDSPAPEQVQREQTRRQLSKLLAEIEKRIQTENERPRKRYIGPSTREEVYAIYYDRLRRRIEDKGTENFPETAGKKMYGELTLAVTVNFDGRIHQVEVVEGSGNRALDRRAVAIARSAGPFGRFNATMRRQAEQIWVVSRFKFTRDETLESRLTAN